MHRWCELLQWSDVIRDEDAAAVRRDNQIAVARMDQDVVGANRGVVVHELLPGLALVQRRVEPELGAGKEQVRVLRVFSHRLHVAVRGEITCQARPALSVIGGLENVRLEIIAAMTINRDVCRRRIEVRWVDPREPVAVICRNPGDVLADFGECLAAVLGQLKVAVVSAGPNEARRHWRLIDRDDRAVIHDAVGLRNHRLVARHAHHRDRAAVDVLGEILACRPCVTAIV